MVNYKYTHFLFVLTALAGVNCSVQKEINQKNKINVDYDSFYCDRFKTTIKNKCNNCVSSNCCYSFNRCLEDSHHIYEPSCFECKIGLKVDKCNENKMWQNLKSCVESQCKECED